MPNHIIMCFWQNENHKRFREMAVYAQILILISKRFCHHCESLVLLVRDKLKCLQSVIIDFTSHSNNTMDFPQGCLISEGILTLVKLQTKGAKSLSWVVEQKIWITYGREIQIFCSEKWFCTFCWQWDQSQNTCWD